MIAKKTEKEKAIALRKKGYSYSEIAQSLPVSKSSLSLWLSEITLGDKFSKRLAERKIQGQRKGATARKTNRLVREAAIVSQASAEITKISKKELWLLGTMAYWCEGSKQKEHNVSEPVTFSNSDSFLAKLFIKWLKEICEISENDIKYTIHIHVSANVEKAKQFWSQTLAVQPERFENTVFKKHKVSTNRKNTSENYHGLIRITVRRSTDLNRKITGWVKGINNFM